MNRKLKIVCDCDNVLLNFSQAFADWHNEQFQDIFLNANPDNYDFDIDDSELIIVNQRIDQFWQSDNMAKIPYMEPSIVKNFKKLRELHDVVVYSAVIDSVCREKRMINLVEFDLLDSEVVLRPDKLVPIINDVKPDICIDDSPYNIEELTAHGIPVFYPSYLNYTRSIDNELAIPYNNWEELLALIEKLCNA